MKHLFALTETISITSKLSHKEVSWEGHAACTYLFASNDLAKFTLNEHIFGSSYYNSMLSKFTYITETFHYVFDLLKSYLYKFSTVRFNIIKSHKARA